MIHRFGEFDLDEDLFELRHQGNVVQMQRRAFDLLTYLVRHSDVVVSKADLTKNVWFDVVVAKDALPHAMMMVRSALGDDVDKPTFIHTIRGRGYRFVAPVERLSGKSSGGGSLPHATMSSGETKASPFDQVMLAASSSLEGAAGSGKAASPLVARSASMALLRERLHRAVRGGAGGLVLVTGDPGIGKTRLLEELCNDHDGPTRSAAHLISVRCYSGMGAPDLWPFTQALRELEALGTPLPHALQPFTTTSRDQKNHVDDVTNGSARHDASVLNGNSASQTPRAHTQQARLEAPEWFRIFDDIVRVFEAVTDKVPLLLIVDDLDLADARSLELLGLLAPRLRSLRMLLVAAHRPATATASAAGTGQSPLRVRVPSFNTTVGALASEPSTCVVTLDPFSRAEVALYLEQVLPKAPASSVVDKVFEKTKGNPLFVSQLVHVLRAEERLRAEEVATSSLVGNENMREAIIHHVSSLPESVARTLTVAAVFGRTFPLAPLAAALETTNAVVLGNLDVASVARIVATASSSDSPVGSYRFTYPLVRDVLYKRLSASDRARLHGSAARALEEHHDQTHADHTSVGAIAAHLAEAAATGEVDRALDWSLKAIELAEIAGDDAAAIKYAERGLAALQFARKPDASKRARLLAVMSRRAPVIG